MRRGDTTLKMLERALKAQGPQTPPPLALGRGKGVAHTVVFVKMQLLGFKEDFNGRCSSWG